MAVDDETERSGMDVGEPLPGDGGSGPAQALVSVVRRVGPAAVTDARRCRAGLADCGLDRRLIAALAGAVEAGAASQIGSVRTGETPEAHLERLARVVHDEMAIEPGLARWAIETWAYALGVRPVAATRAPSADSAASAESTASTEKVPVSDGHSAGPPPTAPAAGGLTPGVWASDGPGGGAATVVGSPSRPTRRRFVAAAVTVAVLLIGVVVAVVAVSGRGSSRSSTTGPSATIGVSTSTAQPVSTAPLTSLTLTTGDVPAGYSRVEGQFEAIPLAACAGATNPVASDLDQRAIVSFTRSGSPVLAETLARYRSGAQAEYSLLVRGVADCRSRVGANGSLVAAAAPFDIGNLGDERTAVAVKFQNPTNPTDFTTLELAAVRIGQVIVTINVSGAQIDAGLTAQLITSATGKLR